jgi:hypothetical protein
LFAPNQSEESFQQPEDTLNMLSVVIEESCNPQVFQVSDGKGVSSQSFIHLNTEKFNACKADMSPTSMAVPGSQMAATNIKKVESKAASMVAEITKTYARKGKVSGGPQPKRDTQQVACPSST